MVLQIIIFALCFFVIQKLPNTFRIMALLEGEKLKHVAYGI